MDLGKGRLMFWFVVTGEGEGEESEQQGSGGPLACPTEYKLLTTRN